MVKTLVEKNLAMDFLRDYFSLMYNFEGFKLKNPTANEITIDLAGHPLKIESGNIAIPVLATDEANTAYFSAVTGQITIPAGETVDGFEVMCIARGPGVLHKGGFPTKDVEGTNFTYASLKTRAEALGFVVRDVDNTQTLTHST